VVIDANEVTIGETNGEKVHVLWSKDSLVPRKHGAGGQSAPRFERNREIALCHWLKDCAEKVLEVYGGRQIVVAGPGMTKDKFVGFLRKDVAERVVDVKSVGYTDENGLWEVIGRSRYIR
jgi:peptide chain release factor subunit 1